MLALLRWIRAIVAQSILAITFRSAGDGLPAKPGGAFAALLVVAVVVFAGRFSIDYSNQSLLFAVIAFCAQLVFFAAAFGASWFQVISLYLCISIGIDGTGLLLSVFGISAPSLLTSWELCATASGFYRFWIKRRDQIKRGDRS